MPIGPGGVPLFAGDDNPAPPLGPGAPDPGDYPDWQRTTLAPEAPARCVAGDDQTWTLGLKAADGTPFVGFQAGNALAATLYRGRGQAPIVGALAPSYAADYGATGDLTLFAPGAATAALPGGQYEALVEAAVGSGLRTCWLGTVEVLPASGSGVPGPSYCAFDDVLEYYPLASRLQSPSDQTGFARAMNTAWARINTAIIRRIPRGGFARFDARRRGAVDDFYGEDKPDRATTPPTIALVRAQLNAGGLIRDATDAPILARAAVDMTLAEILGSKEGGSRATNPFSQSGKEFEAMALEALADFDPYIDMDDPLDGTADIQIVGPTVVYLDGWV